MQKTHYDIVDGYRLEVPEVWHRIAPAERERICNGVGPARWSQAWRDRIGALTHFGPPSKPHDVGYTYGTTEQHRQEEDSRFWRNALFVARKDALWPWCYLLPGKRSLYFARLAQARLAYRVLRRFGGSAFWAGKTRPEHVDK